MAPRNVIGMFRGPDPEKPSPHLEQMVRLDIAERAAAVQATVEREQGAATNPQLDGAGLGVERGIGDRVGKRRAGPAPRLWRGKSSLALRPRSRGVR